MSGELRYTRRNEAFGKALYARDRNVSAPRVLATGAGLGLTAWGVGRSAMVGRALGRGIKAAQGAQNQRAIDALQRAQALQGILAHGTAGGERRLRQIKAVDDAVRRVPASMRPEVAAAAGMLLVGQGHPVRRDRYTPVTIRVRGGAY